MILYEPYVFVRFCTGKNISYSNVNLLLYEPYVFVLVKCHAIAVIREQGSVSI